MIQKKRINNDVFVRWGVFTPEGLPVDLAEVTSITIEARPQSSNGRYPMVSEVVDNFVEAYFLAKDQKVVGKYNLYLTYTIDDPNIIGGVATYTIDYCDAFELLPKSCFVDGEDDVDPVNIQGIIASFTYSMLTEEEKNDLASRLSGNSGTQNLSDLLDVTISNLEIDQILKYDGTKWVNATSTGGSSSNVSWGIPTSQYTPLTVNGVTRNLSLNNHTHHWDTITNRPLTDEQFQDLLEIASLWKLDNDGNLYTERNVYSHGGISAYNWGESPAPPEGVYNLKDLLDVGIINPQEDNILRFNGSHWVNVPSSNVGTLVEWSLETDNYINLSVGDSSKSISLHGHKHEIEDINNLQDFLDFNQDNIPLGDISQYYRGDKEWATLNTDTVVESTNLYYTPERVIGLTEDLYARKVHTHVFNSLTGLPNTLDGYGIIDAYSKTEIDNLISSTSGFWVKSVGLEAPTGFTVSNSPIIYEGNIKLSFASGYSLPSNSKQYNWDLAFSDRHIHTNISVLNELNIDDVNNWNSIQEHLNDYNNPHQVSFRQLNNKPSTLLGYGITDVYNKTEVDYIFSNITPGESTIKNVYEYDSIGQSFSNDTLTDTFNAYTISRLHDRLVILEQGGSNQGDPNQGDPILDTIKNWYNNIGRHWLLDANNDALYTNKNVYSTKGVSALGLGDGSEGGGDGEGIDKLDSWANYTEDKADFYAPASLLVPFRNDTLSRLEALEAGGGAINFEMAITGSGNAVTGVSKSGNTLTFVKDSIFALSTHNHTIANITGLQDALDGKEPSFTKNTAFNKNFGTVAGTVMQGNDSRIHSHSNKALLDLISQSNIDVLNLLSVVDGNIKVNTTLWATGGISALGLGDDGGGSGGGGVDMLDDWTKYTTAKADFYVPASLLVPFRSDILNRLNAIEGGSASEIETTGNGNAITSVSKSGDLLTFNKGLEFSLSNHTHTIAQVTDLQGALDGKQPTISTGTTSQYFRGDKTWQTLNTSVVSEGTNLYFTNARVKTYGDTLYSLLGHTHTITQITGLQGALDNKESAFTKNSAFNKNFGATSGTVAQGNDSRIINGQTAYGWGNHASAGYALNSTLTAHTGNSTIHITATERTNWNLAYTQRHTHGNKSVIDQLLQGDIDVLRKLSVDVDGNVKVDTTLWATGGLSALGLGEEVEEAIDAIEFGGRNLLTDSTNINILPLYGATATYTSVANASVPSGAVFTATNIIRTISNLVFFLPIQNSRTRFKVANGERVTVSFYIKTNVTQILDAPSFNLSTEVNSTWKKVQHNFIFPASGNLHYSLIGAGLTSFEVHSIKMERGNKATDWTPAPEDQVSDWNTTDVTSFNFIKNKPTTFAPSAHTHTIANVTDLQTALNAKQNTLIAGANITISGNTISSSGGTSSVAWGNITGKPSTFAPSAHTHTIANVTDLQSALNGKSNTGHTHNYLSLTGGTMTGILTAQNNTSYTTKQVRNMILSTSNAISSQMANGDIWIKYE